MPIQTVSGQQEFEIPYFEKQVERFIPYGSSLNVYDVDVNTKTKTVFFTDSDNHSLVSFSLKENKTENVKIVTYPFEVAVNSATNKAYVTHACNCPASLGLTVVDFSKGEESDRVHVIPEISKYAAPVALNQITNRVYVGSNSSSITVIDGSSDNVIGKIDDIDAKEIVVNQNTNTIYAVSDRTLYRIDGATNKVEANLLIDNYAAEIKAIGNKISALAVNPNTNIVYLINGILNPPSGPNEGISIPIGYLMTINGTSNAVINPNISRVTSFSFDIAVNPDTNRVYVLGNSETPIQDGPRDEIISISENFVGQNIKALIVEPGTSKIYLRGQTGIFIISDKESVVPEFSRSSGYVMSPLKQVANGINARDVVCKDRLQLIIKSSNGHPACVKPSSVSKLIARGWTDWRLPLSEEEQSVIINLATHDPSVQKLLSGKDWYVRAIQAGVSNDNECSFGSCLFILIDQVNKNQTLVALVNSENNKVIDVKTTPGW